MAKLIGRTGAVAGQDFVLTDNVRLGASSESDIRIAVDGVSRRHARIFRESDHFWLEDTGATNGTFLNGVRIVRESLHHLDVVTLGRAVDLIFLAREDEPVPPPDVDQLSDVKLEILDGPEVGAVMDVPRGEITLGRALSCNVVLNSPAVGRAHARIERSAKRLLVEDLQSANGTQVNGKTIDGTKMLSNGDVITLAGVRSVSIRFSGRSSPSLPDDEAILSDSRRFNQEWKTRFMWAPEELAQIESARADAIERAKLREPKADARKPAAKSAAAAAPAAAAKKPPSPVPAQKPPTPAAAQKPMGPPAAVAKPASPAGAVPVERPEAAAAAKPASPAPAVPGERVEAPPAPSQPAVTTKLPAAAAKPEVTASPKPAEAVAPARAAQPQPAANAASPVPPMPDAAAAPAAGPASPKPAATPKEPPSQPPSAQVVPSATSDTAKLSIDSEQTIRRPTPGTPIQGVRLIGPRGATRLGVGTFKIGRAVDADVRLDDRQVSRAHALLLVEETSVVIEDLKTVNGTLVNGREIRGRQKINAGDVVRVGDSSLTVEII